MQGVRFLFFPFSVLYDGVTRLRNFAFNIGILSHKSYPIPVIAVGNLSTGGTGKTPMIEYLVQKHSDKRVAILSRGYGRSSKGFKEVISTHSAKEVGDEPLQFKRKYDSAVIVAVCESRVAGINQLMERYELDLILLDDAYQHRYVKASRYVLLTSYDKPYFNDYLLPAGNLRESRRGARRANDIVITKCPEILSAAQRDMLIKKINPLPSQNVYLSYIGYSLYAVNRQESIALKSLKDELITVVTGIAKPQPFIDFLSDYMQVEHLRFKDHHEFSKTELHNLATKKIIITTEKDFMRLDNNSWNHVFYVPIEMKFIGNYL